MAIEPRARPRKALDLALFRKAMGAFATGVTVVTAADGERVHGMTANAFMSGSLEPPLCLVAVGKRARTHALIAAARRFGITVLGRHQEAVARHFAGQRVDEQAFEFAELARTPVLAEGVVRIVATLHSALDCGDHTLFVGEAIEAALADHAPLVYHRGAFRAFAERPAAFAPAPEFW
jgi:flavin reductase (DIM6/NTAB) family NADH-FMN oxidoreductase RutF